MWFNLMKLNALNPLRFCSKAKATLEHLREFKSVENSKISRNTEVSPCPASTC